MWTSKRERFVFSLGLVCGSIYATVLLAWLARELG